MPFHRTLTTLLAATAASAALAGPAHADSIAFVKGGDVWLTSTDGARQFQVTGSGGFSHVSQADDGSLLAVAGGDLVHLDPFGQVLSDIRTPVSTAGTSLFSFYGPYDADISPNGQTAAYGWFQKGFQNNSTGAIDYEEHNGHGFTRTGALTGFTDDGFRYAKSWDAPEFIDDQTVLVSNGPGWPSDPFAVETVGSGDPQGWFTDPDNMHPLEATVSRNRRVIAAVVGPDRQGIAVYRDWDGQLKGSVSKCFTYGSDGHDGAPAMESPTLNADGTVLAYSDGHDLMVAPLGAMTDGCPDGVNAKDVVAGATSPDWGPADVPASRPASIPLSRPAGATPAGKPAAAAIPAPAPAGPSLTVSGPSGKVRGALKHGFAITVQAPAGTVTVTAVAGKTVVAKRTAKVGPSGRATITLKLNHKGADRLRRRHHLSLVLTATQGAASARSALRL